MIDAKFAMCLQNKIFCIDICGTKSRQMNDLHVIKSLKENEKNFKFSLCISTLHCGIRFMECILHIAYNMDFKMDRVSGENKVLKEEKEENSA